MFYLFTAFISGMAVTVVELAAARLVAPFFGASLIVWTNVIGIILAGLALGYSVGGRLADRTSSSFVLFRILGVAAVLVFLTPFLVRPLSTIATIDAWVGGSASIVLILGSFLVTTFLFFLPIVLLGMVSPFLIVLLHRTKDGAVGAIAGRVFSWSTLGSILGVFCTGLLFIPFFGTRKTIMGAAVVLLLLAFVGERRWYWGALACGGLVFLLLPANVFGPLRYTRGLLFERESPYEYVRVNEIDGRRYLIFNEGLGAQSVFDPATIETGSYHDYFAALPLLFPNDRPLSILMIGFGGGTFVRHMHELYQDRLYTIDAVEIDPVVVEAARGFFHVPEERLAIHIADGRMFLATTRDVYDMILIDAYSQELYIPWHLTTQEFFSLVRSRLAPDGIVALNVVGADASAPLVQSILKTLTTSFPFVMRASLADTWNHILIAAPSELSFDRFSGPFPHAFLEEVASALAVQRVYDRGDDGQLLTDDHAPIEFLTDIMVAREAILQ